MAGKLILKITAGCLVLSMIAAVSAVIGNADTLSDYEKKQKELDEQAKQYQAIIDSTASDIAQREEYQTALRNKITVLNSQIQDGREEIERLSAEIAGLQTSINESSEKISVRIDGLKQRVRAVYLSGQTTSLEIILGAKSFDDFLDNLELVAYMSNSDRKLIDRLQSDIDIINKKKNSLDEKRTQLDEEQKKLSARQTELQHLIDENQQLLEGLYSDNAGAQDHLDETNAERQKIEDLIKAYYADQETQKRNARLASEEQSKLNESKRKAESSSSVSSRNNSSRRTDVYYISSNTSRYDDTVSTYEYDDCDNDYDDTVTSRYDENSSSEWEETSSVYSSENETSSATSSCYTTDTSSAYEWPVPGHYVLTSVWNEDRTTYNHGAIDIADENIMNAPVVAAQSGVVALSNDDCVHNYGKDGSCGCGGGYGNYLMIDHGEGKATLYAHLTSLTVSTGDYVQKGQVIGYVGTTGWSTGPHLHFETRLYGEKYNPMTEYPNI